MNKRKAFITGIGGQDGSYLAELLLSKEYEVHGIIRRNSTPEHQQTRLENIQGDLNVEYGDLQDYSTLERSIKKIQPDEIYNIGAQSHVRISFDLPVFTFQTNAAGTLNMLEAYRQNCPQARFYQASSSEMFGNCVDDDGFQRETTPMHPVSPYGCSKLAAYSLVRNYRHSYKLFASNGILFNHECVSENTVLTLQSIKTGVITVKRIKDIVPLRQKGTTSQQFLFEDWLIWDGFDFVALYCATATKLTTKKNDDNFTVRLTNTRNGIVETTNHHNLLNENGEKIHCNETGIGDHLLHGGFPTHPGRTSTRMTLEEAFLLGALAGDGYVSTDGKARLINSDENNLGKVSCYWNLITLGTASDFVVQNHEDSYGTSMYVNLQGAPDYSRMLRKELYTKDGYKKVPDRILNAAKETQFAFLQGYNMCDGLKANPCTYEFKNFKTNSSLLAQGLLYLVSKCTQQDFNVTFEKNDKHFGYYSINLLTDKETSKGKHLRLPSTQIKKVIYHDQPEWVFDLETATGKFMAGVGNMIIANSPRRGSNFVTSKVVKAAVRIKYGLQDKLELGNMDSYRDWGHSKDYVKAMWSILQQDKPVDLVISTMQTHSVRELCEYVFGKLDLKIENHITQNPKFLRPEELKYLKGDSTKAREQLNWKPEYSFETLLDEMIQDWVVYYEQKLVSLGINDPVAK